ncbi:MAG: bifunctional aspartate kinase/homoserine dehydrogenase I [Gammaproteobacteria bacterium CG22_combo_CG10-13_8_21_14_all_40_8]|nr:MAG: bifunctional aspartate kinase/homoserine dehydrogenase I [Gammaproteobacteria bacterium CG22_combo_CG10-13_8_21_14_all_40_8]
MKAMKFGGSSLANAHKFLAVSNIILQQIQTIPDARVAVVLSAPHKVTDQLESLVFLARHGVEYKNELHQLELFFTTLIDDLGSENRSINLSNFKPVFQQEIITLTRYLEGVALLRQCPDNIFAQILVVGERLSVVIMQQILSRQQVTLCLDPKQFFVASSHFLEAKVDLEASFNQFEKFDQSQANIWLMPGFTAANKQGQLVTLGRNGSDYSATCLAACLRATSCEIWTDVNGVYSADPNVVKDAQLLAHLSYAEAMELSYFGAKVLHPKTIEPIAKFKIPCFIKNTSNPEAQGTEISDRYFESGQVVAAISTLNNMSLCTVSGSGMKGMVGMASRIFAAISRADISISLITQSSSEYSISFCIAEDQCDLVTEVLQAEFELELASGLIDPMESIHRVTILSLIGDHMKRHPGVSANFFQSLAHANINIIAIAQGSSERSISVVISQQEGTKALLASHFRFFDARQRIEIFLLGCGNVGKGLLQQILHQQHYLQQRKIQLKVCAIANSRQHCLTEEGIDLESWAQEISQNEKPISFDHLLKASQNYALINPVIIDCTPDEKFVAHYAALMQAGFHVVTPNKKANSGSWEQYQKLREASLSSQRLFLYDTNVGAGLPVIENLQKLLSAGDSLIKFEGILSGSLSFIFGLLDDGVSLSQATAIAREKCFTEPDPRDDLSGMDVARKILILARETGLKLSMDDVVIQSVLPDEFDSSGSIEQFLQNIPQADETHTKLLQQAQAQNKRLRYVATLENGQCSVGIKAVDEQHPLYAVKNGENALAFYSQYYHPIPLVLRGYGAGVNVTAAGIFADVLRTLGFTKEV